MSLVRSWLSGTARALGVSILVPLVLVGVLLGATVGGVEGLRSLRQLVAGPAIPDDRPGTVHSDRTRRPTVTLPTIPPGRTVLASGRERQSELGHTDSSSRERATRTPGSETQTPAPATGPTPPAAQEPDPGGDPTPRPRPLAPVRALGERVRRAIEPLPAPVGPTASDAIETVLDIVDPPSKKRGGLLGTPAR